LTQHSTVITEEKGKMNISLKEDLFAKLLDILEHKFKRVPQEYSFVMEKKTDLLSSFSGLESFLRVEHIPYCKIGISVNSQSMLPASMFIEGDTDLLPSGLYFIYPETDQEIMYYFYMELTEEHRDAPHYIVGFKKVDVHSNFLKRYETFLAAKIREKGMVVVYGGRDIPRPCLTWDDLILPEALKDDIRLNIENFMTGEKVYRKFGIPYKRGLLFTGLPGNGKTMLLKVITSSYPSWQAMMFRCNILTNNNDLDNFFELAADFAPSILCFEDVDTLFTVRITLSHFLNKLDGFENLDRILLLATTNHPENIDPALISRPSRFDRVWIIGLPDFDCRYEYLKRCFNGNLSEPFLSELAQATEGFSVTYLKELYVSASIRAIQGSKHGPDENDVEEVLDLLSSQLKGAKQHFFVLEKKRIGFGEG
jgi:hypothetical protein